MKNPQPKPLHFSFKAPKAEYEEYKKRIEDCELVTIMFNKIEMETTSGEGEMTVHCQEVFASVVLL